MGISSGAGAWSTGVAGGGSSIDCGFSWDLVDSATGSSCFTSLDSLSDSTWLLDCSRFTAAGGEEESSSDCWCGADLVSWTIIRTRNRREVNAKNSLEECILALPFETCFDEFVEYVIQRKRTTTCCYKCE